MDPLREVLLVDEDGRVSGDLDEGRLAHRDDRRPGRHRLHDGEPEALEARRLHETGGAAVELCEAFRRHVALEPRAAAAKLLCERRVLRRPGDDERKPGRGGRLERRELVLPGLDRPHGERVVAL